MRTLHSILFLFLTSHFFGQVGQVLNQNNFPLVDSFKTIIYYDFDKYLLTKKHNKQLIDFLEKIDTTHIAGIEIFGHSDTLAGEKYNLKLSEKRANEARRFIKSKNINIEKITVYSLGSSSPIATNSTEEGRQRNRRTEILVKVATKRLIHLQNVKQADDSSYNIQCNTQPLTISKDTIDCKKDTTLIFQNGTQVTLNICEYIKIKDCFSFTEIVDGNSLRQSNITTMTTENEPLISGGIFDIKLCNGVCATVRIPIRENCVGNLPMTLWDAFPGNTWGNSSKETINIVKSKNQNYYEVNVCKSGMKNCDVRPPIKLPRAKFIAKKKLKIVDIKTSFDCPPALYIKKPRKKNQRKIKFDIPCPSSDLMVSARVLNEKGDTLTMDYTFAKNLDKNEMFGYCKQDTVIKKFLFFEIQKKSIYKKYFLYPDNFDQTTTSKAAPNMLVKRNGGVTSRQKGFYFLLSSQRGTVTNK